MSPGLTVAVLFGLVLGFLVFRLALDLEWHWGVALFLGFIPLALTFFFPLYGLIAAALFVGAMYKAAARS